MDGIAQTLSDFGKNLGIADFSLNPQGIVCLQFQTGRQIVVESIGDDILIYLVQPAPFPSAEFRMAALCKAEFRQGAPFAYQVGMQGSGQESALVVLVRAPVRDFTLSLLERVVESFQSRWSEQSLR